jgi:hypothetical protein
MRHRYRERLRKNSIPLQMSTVKKSFNIER